MHDAVGDRMKQMEREFRPVVPAGSFLACRVDGRAFHTYTRGLDRPFDRALMADLDAAAVEVAAEFSGCVAVYVQSDELSIIATDATSERAEHFFGGVCQKVASVTASMVTASFVSRRPGRVAVFDGRCFALPAAADVTDYLAWRQADARRNAVSMLCHHHLGHRKVHGCGTRQRVEMLAEHGVDVAGVDAGFVNGRLVARSRTVEPVRYRDKRTGSIVEVADVVRRRWVVTPAPRFTADVVGDLIADRIDG